MQPPSPTLPEARPPRQFNALPLILIIAAAAVAIPFLFVSPSKPAGDAVINWRTDIDAALTEAKSTNKPLFVDFMADWCPPCKVMKREVFSLPEVKAHLESKFIPVKLDMTDRNAERTRELGGRFRIKYLPTMLVLDAEGNERHRESGGMSAEELIAWLSK